MNKRFLLCLFLKITFTVYLFAQSPLTDPQIPDAEQILYKLVADKKTEYITEITRIIKEEDHEYYKLVSKSPDKTTVTKFLKKTLEALYFSSEIDANEHSISSQQSITLKPGYTGQEIRLVDFSALLFALRGYPFDKPKTLKIKIFSEDNEINSSEESFSMGIKYVRMEEVTINKQKIKCHRLELVINLTGAMALFGGLVPKTYFWYTTASPHYLVKFQGSGGQGNSGQRVITLENYSLH